MSQRYLGSYFFFLLTSCMCGLGAVETPDSSSCPAIEKSSSEEPVVTRGGYAEILIGTSFEEMIAKLGEPYALKDVGEKEQEAEYIERFEMNGQLAYLNHYFFTIKEGKVVSKRVETDNRPAYDLMYEEDPNYPTYP